VYSKSVALLKERTKESNFSAMVSSGKFNSTHLVLGLDQLIVNEVPQVGFYIRNDQEMKVVEWVMRTFVKYASYQKVLEECQRSGVKNKNGKPFLRHSLITLLTNKKYIGKWESKRRKQSRTARSADGLRPLCRRRSSARLCH
jgi:hypothetical protein